MSRGSRISPVCSGATPPKATPGCTTPPARTSALGRCRAFIEEVHFGSTPEEARRLWWDISWIWGPPEDHLATLLDTIGVERFVFGTGQPLRLPETSVAKLDLLDVKRGARDAIESTNLQGLMS